MNQHTIMGRLGTEPQLKQFDNGGKIATFSVATDDSYVDKEGKKVERADWHNVVCRDKQAEFSCKWLRKGARVLITGKSKNRKYTDLNGVEKYTTEIHAINIHPIDWPEKNQPQQQQYSPPQQQHSPAPAPATSSANNDDLPF